jgi:hypothetical protein
MANEPIGKEEMKSLLSEQARILGGIINKSNAKDSSSYTAPYSGSYDPFISSGNLFKDTIVGTIPILGDLGSGTFKASEAFRTVTKIIGQFGTVGDVAALALDQLGQGLDHANNALNETARYGMTFGQNISGFNESVLRANLTIPEFVSIVQQGSRQIVGLGGNASASGKAFLSLLEEFNKSEIGKQLKEAGMAPKELADVMLINAGVMTRANTLDVNAKYQAELSAERLADEMNRVADLTGKSRKQQEAELQKVSERADVQAEILEHMAVDPNFGPNLLRASDGLSVYGNRAMQAIAEASTSVGIHTKEMTQFVGSLGTAGGEITKYGQAIRSGNVVEIERQKKVTEEALARQMMTSDYTAMMKYQNGSILGVGRDFEQSAKYLQALRGEQIDLAKKQSEKTGQIVSYQDISIAQARDSLIEQGKLSREGKLKDEKTGEVTEDPKALLAKILNDLNGVGKAASVETAKMFSGLNDQLSKTVSTDFPNFTKSLRDFSDPAFMENKIKKSFDQSVEGVLNKLKIPVSGRVPGTNDILLNNPPKTETPKKETGSPGTVGSMVEDFGKGTLIETHGREGVLTEQQQLNLVRGSVDTGSKDAFANMQRTLTAMISSVNTKEPSANPEARETVKIDSDVLADKINNIKVPDFTEPLNQFISQFSKITPPDFSEVEGHVIKEASKIKFPDLPLEVMQFMNGVKIPDLAPIFNDVSNKMSQVQIPDFTKPLDDLTNQIGTFEIPDPVEPDSDGIKDLTSRMESIFKQLAGDFDATIKGPDRLTDFLDKSNINTEELNNQITQIKAPDFNNLPVFRDILTTLTTNKTETTTKTETETAKREDTERSAPIQRDASLKDVVDHLDKLNKSIMQMVGHTEKLTDYSNKQIRATQSLSNNRFAM